MNMMGLWAFGGFLEPVLGWRRLPGALRRSALAGSLASALSAAPASGGASGALWGLMLGGSPSCARARPSSPPASPASSRQRLVGIVGINVVISFVPNIDKFAHFGGGIAASCWWQRPARAAHGGRGGGRVLPGARCWRRSPRC
jgi:membrane associated rhomboid family serine protease